MAVKKNTKKTVRKVIKGLRKASRTHAKQAKSLSALKLKKGGSATKKNSCLFFFGSKVTR